MSDVRVQLAAELRLMNCNEYQANKLADAILARFEVTAKPVVTAGELGAMFRKTYTPDSPERVTDWDVRYGAIFLDRLEAKGLTIVRSGEG